MVTDYFVIYTVLKRLMMPFDKWKAFASGVIDASGKVLVKPAERTLAQKASFTPLDIMILNIKKMLLKLPGGGSRIATLAAAFLLLREDVQPEDITVEELAKEIDHLSYDPEYKNFADGIVWQEDAPTTNIGSGHIATPEKPWRSKFAGQMVFRVKPNVFKECNMGKFRYHRWDKYVGEDEIGIDIRDFGKANPNADIIVQDETTEAMMYLRKKSR